MKLQDFIIGIGLFGLFTIIIFGAINPDNDEGIYGENYLNITVDDNTTATIKRFGALGENASQDFDTVSGDINDFTTNRSTSEEAGEDSLLVEGIKLLFAIPKFFLTIPHVLGEMTSVFGIDPRFMQWMVMSVVVIIVLMIATAFLRNKLQS